MADGIPPLDMGAPLIPQLWQFRAEKAPPVGAASDILAMFAGRDNVHGALLSAIRSARSSLVMNMYGYDDPEIDDAVWDLIENPAIHVAITLDKTQAGGLAERKILDAHRVKDLASFNNHILIGSSATHQISHTKAGVIDGILTFHGSVNLSKSGEGVFTQPDGPGGVGFKAQNNSLSWHTDRQTCIDFTTELAKDRAAMLTQQKR
jgi:phosphatidylserine/phosphatidylglycerophosphate/cardiolipin synthase-like enzyme